MLIETELERARARETLEAVIGKLQAALELQKQLERESCSDE